MKNSMKKIIAAFTLVLFVTMTLIGCSASYDGAKESVGEIVNDSKAETGDILNYGSDLESTTNGSAGTGESESSTEVAANRKIIEKVYIYAQTKEFDSLLDKIDEEIAKVGGYIENSSVSGNNYEYDQNRHAELTIRVPAEKSNEFTTFVSENSTVTSKEISTDDVTLSYVDMESRVTALETEKKTLERLMEEADTMTDVISIQERLTEVIYEIESYESQLRTYDNLIEFTTVTVNISEVERVAIVEEQTVWEEIGTNLKRNFENVGRGFERFFVFIVSSIPYLLIIAGYAAVVIVIIVVCKKRYKKRKQLKTESADKNDESEDTTTE